MQKIMKKSILVFILLIIFTLLTNQVTAGGESRAASSSASPSSHSSTISAIQDNATIAMAVNPVNTNNGAQMIQQNSNTNNNGNMPVFGTPIITSTTYSNTTTTSAKLNGIVDPKGYATQAWFEIQNGNATLIQNIGNGNSSVTLTPYNLIGLTPNTTYSFRISASNQNGTTNGAWISFTTLSNSNGGGNGGGGGGGYIVSTVSTENAASISTNSARLNGTVYHTNYSTSTYFQYGTLSNLGSYIETAHITAGGLNSSLAFNKAINGLAPNTTYYFRAVANSNGGTRYGNIHSFKTLPIVIINNNENNNNNNNSNKKIIIVDEEVNTDEIVEPVVNTIDATIPENNSNLSANAFYGFNAFLPSTIFQWILLIILILAIIFVSRKIYLNTKKEKDINVNANHIDNLPV